MRTCTIPYFINGLNYCIKRSIIAYGKICSANVIINCGRNPYHGNIVLCCKDQSAGKCAVTTNNNKCIDPCLLKIFKCLLTTFGSLKSPAPGRFKKSSTFINNVLNRSWAQILNIIFDKALVSSENTCTGNAVI